MHSEGASEKNKIATEPQRQDRKKVGKKEKEWERRKDEREGQLPRFAPDDTLRESAAHGAPLHYGLQAC